MVYELKSKNLRDYFFARLNSLKPSQRTSMGLETEISGNNHGIVLFALEKNKSIITPCFAVKEPFNQIELRIKTDTIGIDNKQEVRSFLDYMNEDVIFQRGEPLYSPEREVKILDWKKVLQRENSGRKHSMICSIIDRNVGDSRLNGVIYEYMFRPCLYHVFHQGEFGNQNTK